MGDVDNDFIAIGQILSQPKDDVDVLLYLLLVDAIAYEEYSCPVAYGRLYVFLVRQALGRSVLISIFAPFPNLITHRVVTVVDKRTVNILPHGVRSANEKNLIGLDKLLHGFCHEGCAHRLVAQPVKGRIVLARRLPGPYK